ITPRSPFDTLSPDQLGHVAGGQAAANAAGRVIVLMKGPKTAMPKTPISAGRENLEHAWNHNWKATNIVAAVRDAVGGERAATLDHAVRYLNGVAAHLKMEKSGL